MVVQLNSYRTFQLVVDIRNILEYVIENIFTIHCDFHTREMSQKIKNIVLSVKRYISVLVENHPKCSRFNWNRYPNVTSILNEVHSSVLWLDMDTNPCENPFYTLKYNEETRCEFLKFLSLINRLLDTINGIHCVNHLESLERKLKKLKKAILENLAYYPDAHNRKVQISEHKLNRMQLGRLNKARRLDFFRYFKPKRSDLKLLDALRWKEFAKKNK